MSIHIKVSGKLSQVRLQGWNYSRFLLQLIIDCWQNFRLHSFIIAFFTGLGLVGQYIGFAGLLFSLKAIQTGEDIEIEGFIIPINSLNDGILLIGIFAAIILISTSLFHFLAARNVIRVSRRYEDLLVQKLLTNISLATVYTSAPCHFFDTRELRLHCMRGAAMTGRSLRRLLSGLVDLSFLLAYISIVLFIIDPVAIFVILVVSILYFGMQYLINLKSATATHVREQNMRGASLKLLSMLDLAINSPKKLKKDSVENFFKNSERNQALTAFENRLIAVAESLLTTQIFSGFGLLIVVGVVVWRFEDITQGIGELLTLLILLRLAFGSLGSVLSTVTTISRFYPNAKKYFLIRKEMEEYLSSLPDTHNSYISQSILRKELNLIYSDDEYRLTNESPLLFFNGSSNERYMIAAVLSNLPSNIRNRSLNFLEIDLAKPDDFRSFVHKLSPNAINVINIEYNITNLLSAKEQIKNIDATTIFVAKLDKRLVRFLPAEEIGTSLILHDNEIFLGEHKTLAGVCQNYSRKNTKMGDIEEELLEEM